MSLKDELVNYAANATVLEVQRKALETRLLGEIRRNVIPDLKSVKLPEGHAINPDETGVRWLNWRGYANQDSVPIKPEVSLMLSFRGQSNFIPGKEHIQDLLEGRLDFYSKKYGFRFFASGVPAEC